MKNLKKILFSSFVAMSCLLSGDEGPYIIYLNGPSSSGKSTLAKELQNALRDPYLHIGIDKLIGFMPARINNWEGGPAPLGFSWEKGVDASGHPISRIHAGPYAKKITQSLKDIVLLLASQGYNLIIDDVSFGANEVDEWKKALKDYTVLYVGVQAPLEVLEEREKGRGDRIIGGARDQYNRVHENVDYDIKVDTHARTVQENAKIIVKALFNK